MTLISFKPNVIQKAEEAAISEFCQSTTYLLAAWKIAKLSNFGYWINTVYYREAFTMYKYDACSSCYWPCRPSRFDHVPKCDKSLRELHSN